jgi:hypothetical protein
VTVAVDSRAPGIGKTHASGRTLVWFAGHLLQARRRTTSTD